MTTPLLPLKANDELVAVTWIGTCPGLTPAMVATVLPADVNPDGTAAAWVQTGFITVAVVGGNPDPGLPVHRPVMQVDCWATVPGSSKPPWGQAAALASAIQAATWDRTQGPRPLTIVANGVTYPQANVRVATVLTAPRRIYADTADYARFQMDLALDWISAGDRLY